jgi:hypothetical protein
MSTRAISFPKKKKIAFEVVRYDHFEKGAVVAAQAIGFELERTIKTLVVTTESGEFALALVPGSGQLAPSIWYELWAPIRSPWRMHPQPNAKADTKSAASALLPPCGGCRW